MNFVLKLDYFRMELRQKKTISLNEAIVFGIGKKYCNNKFSSITFFSNIVFFKKLWYIHKFLEKKLVIHKFTSSNIQKYNKKLIDVNVPEGRIRYTRD